MLSVLGTGTALHPVGEIWESLGFDWESNPGISKGKPFKVNNYLAFTRSWFTKNGFNMLLVNITIEHCKDDRPTVIILTSQKRIN